MAIVPMKRDTLQRVCCPYGIVVELTSGIVIKFTLGKIVDIPGVNGTAGAGGGRESKMSEVKIKENESLDNALRRFKRQCAKSGVLSEVRKREHYEKPSVRRKKKAEAARRKNSRRY